MLRSSLQHSAALPFAAVPVWYSDIYDVYDHGESSSFINATQDEARVTNTKLVTAVCAIVQWDPYCVDRFRKAEMRLDRRTTRHYYSSGLRSAR
jgi:hypothetical protein